jgi:hypothetical protein
MAWWKRNERLFPRNILEDVGGAEVEVEVVIPENTKGEDGQALFHEVRNIVRKLNIDRVKVKYGTNLSGHKAYTLNYTIKL